MREIAIGLATGCIMLFFWWLAIDIDLILGIQENGDQ